MPDHIFCHRKLDVILAIMHLEPESNEAGEDGRSACLGLDWGRSLSWLNFGNSQTVCYVSLIASGYLNKAYGRILGPIKKVISAYLRLSLELSTFPHRSLQKSACREH
jgi:hypothetical protein